MNHQKMIKSCRKAHAIPSYKCVYLVRDKKFGLFETIDKKIN